MNRENIQKVRDVIAGLKPKQFSMNFVASDGRRDVAPAQLLHQCGTAGCIAGWAIAVRGAEIGDETAPTAALETAADYLGIDIYMGADLFMPPDYDLKHYSQPHAVRVLDHLLETGEVDWVSTRRAKRVMS